MTVATKDSSNPSFVVPLLLTRVIIICASAAFCNSITDKETKYCTSQQSKSTTTTTVIKNKKITTNNNNNNNKQQQKNNNNNNNTY